MTTDTDSLSALADRTAHLEELRAVAQDVLSNHWTPERSRDLLDADDDTWAPELWQLLRELGWPELLLDGAGTASDLAVLTEAIGARTAPVPLVTTAVAEWCARDASPAARAGSADSGVSMVMLPGTLAATGRSDGAWELSGTQALVPFAHVAAFLVAHGRAADGTEVVVLIEVNAPGVAMEPVRPLDALPAAAVRFEGVRATAECVLAEGDAAAQMHAGAHAQLMLGWTSELIGVAAGANALAVDYARERVAFDRPIGSFQAIKHRLVDQRAALEVGRALVARAALAIEADADDADALVGLAAFWALDSLRAVPEGAIQVFGGIGYTWEHVAHVYLRRAAVLTALLGNRSTHREVAAAWLRRR